MGKLIKDAENSFFKSAYASLENVLEVVKPVFLDNGIAIIQGSGVTEKGINVITRLIHESGQWIETDFPAPLSKQDPQAAGSASSYGRRYSLKGIACLAEEDDDGNGAKDESEDDPRSDRSKESLMALTDTQLKEINDLFLTLETPPNTVMATCRKYSADRTECVEALMKSEAKRLIPKLRAAVKQESAV